jgi:hypothetical protein
VQATTPNEIDGVARDFEDLVQRYFSFLEEGDYAMARSSWVSQRGSPRDATANLRYQNAATAVDIGYALGELNLGILVRKKGPDGQVVSREPSSFAYFEPYVEYITGGSVKPVVPTSYPRDSTSRVATIAELRKKMLSGSMEQIVSDLAKRFEQYGKDVMTAGPSSFESFHAYYRKKRQVGD